MSKETIKVVEINTDPAKKSIKDLRKELMELKNQMANLEEGGDEFLEIANKAGELKHQLDEINESVKGASADFGDMVGNITNVAAGLTGAFQAVAGGLQAMGLESKAIDETIKRMQGLMAVTQGLSSIDTAIKSWDKLEKVIGTTAYNAVLKFTKGFGKIGLAVAAVTALGVAFVKLKERIDGTSTALKERETAQKNFNTELEKELEIRKRAGYEEEELINFEIAKIEIRNRELKAANRELQEQNDLVSRNAQAAQSAAGMYGSAAAAAAYSGVAQSSNINVGENTRLIRENTNEIEENDNKLKELRKTLDIISQARVLASRRTKDATEAETDDAAERKKNYDDEAQTIEYLIGLYKELYGEDSIAFKKEELNLAERALSNIKSYFGETSEEYKKQLLIVLDLRKALEELTKEKPLSQKEIEEALENDRLKEMAKGWLYNEETAIETFDRIEKELKLSLDRELITQQQYDTAVKNLAKERSRYIADQSVKAFASTANFVTTLLDGIADQQDQNNKEGFERSKKLQIASATIQMFAGITTALAGAFTTKTGPWDIVLASLQAATIAASGILNINKIKNTTFDGGGSATPSAGAVNATIVPPVQYSQAVQGASTEGAIANQKVYVTESDIVDTIGKVSVQETENTY